MVQENSWVFDLLRIYQYSKIGNADNRGLDSEFAKQTYVPTKLDTQLLPDILNGKYKAIFLTGNAGDGKTAFLEKVLIEIVNQGAQLIKKDFSGWEVKFNSKIYISCYDASESANGGKTSSNIRLHGLYNHLRGSSEPLTNIVVLTAINDGKLHAFFNENKNEYRWLSSSIFNQIFNNENVKDESVCIVNLKQRSLIDLDFDNGYEESLFDKTIKLFTEKEKWRICESCDLHKDCPIFYNASVIGFSKFSNLIRARLKLLFVISYLRKQRHNTIRNIRSALSLIVTSNLTCNDVFELLNNNQEDFTKYYYYNSIFNSPDETLNELRDIDPDIKSLPKIDRELLKIFNSKENNIIKNQLLTKEIEHNVHDMNLFDDYKLFIKNWRRRLFFELDDELIAAYQELAELENSKDLLPYYHLNAFIKYITKKEKLDDLKKEISRGVAQLEGIRNSELSQKYLLIKVTQNIKEGLTVCRKFDLEEYQIIIPQNHKLYIEAFSNLIVLRHNTSGIQVCINLDVYEIIRRLAEGQLPNIEEQIPILDELNEFKSRLHRSRSEEILLIESTGLLHHVKQIEGKIVRQSNGAEL